jgi:hypothetical protein
MYYRNRRITGPSGSLGEHDGDIAVSRCRKPVRSITPARSVITASGIAACRTSLQHGRVVQPTPIRLLARQQQVKTAMLAAVIFLEDGADDDAEPLRILRSDAAGHLRQGLPVPAL